MLEEPSERAWFRRWSCELTTSEAEPFDPPSPREIDDTSKLSWYSIRSSRDASSFVVGLYTLVLSDVHLKRLGHTGLYLDHLRSEISPTPHPGLSVHVDAYQ